MFKAIECDNPIFLDQEIKAQKNGANQKGGRNLVAVVIYNLSIKEEILKIKIFLKVINNNAKEIIIKRGKFVDKTRQAH
eukprot:SAG11_NODE_25358_length_359_cov_43.888462_1_plen_78_part_10